MRITITYQSTPGPAQVETITLRVASDNTIEAIIAALNFLQTTQITTVPIVSITITQDNERKTS